MIAAATMATMAAIPVISPADSARAVATVYTVSLLATLPIVIFTSAESPSPHDQQIAWASALVLISLVLVGSILGRVLSLRTRRQIEQAR